MSTQEYFNVFESILYAAIVTQLFVGWSRMIAQKGTYKLDWLHFLITVLTLLYVVQRYFSGQRFAHYEYMTSSFMFLIIVVLPLGFGFLMVHSLFPKTCKNVDFKEVVVKDRFVLGLGFFSMLLYTLFGNIFLTDRIYLMNVLPHGVFILLWTLFMITRKRIFAVIAVVLGTMAICYFLWTV